MYPSNDFKEKIIVEVRNTDKTLPWMLCRGTAGDREAIRH